MATSTESSSAAATSATTEDVSVMFHMNPHRPRQAVFTITISTEDGIPVPPTLEQELQTIAQHIAA